MATLNLPEGLDLLDRRTRFARMALIAYMVISLADIMVLAGEMTGAIDVEASDASLIDNLGGLVYVLFALALLGSVVVVALWIYRAHANLRAAEAADLQFTPGWAVGWYFIPFANLIQPFHAMRELWNSSLIEDGSYGQDADPRLKIWWGTWVAGNIISNIASRLQGSIGTEAATAGYALDIVATGLLIAASWYLLKIIETVNAAQRGGTTLAHAFA